MIAQFYHTQTPKQLVTLRGSTPIQEYGENAKLTKFTKAIFLPSIQILKSSMDNLANILNIIAKEPQEERLKQITF